MKGASTPSTRWMIIRGICATLSAMMLSSSVRAAEEKAPLPIVPGAAGFGMETPAGSGRHLNEAKRKPGWDKALVAHWDFDDGKPGGTLTGDARLVARDKGWALRLNGKGALKVHNVKGYMKPGSSFTIAGWIRLEAPRGLLARNATKAGGYWDLGHFIQGQSKWMFHVRGDDRAAYHAAWKRPITTARWRHVVGVYESATGTARLYVNGSQMASATHEKVKGLSAAQSSNLSIGNGVKGLVDDVMLFKAALTSEQIMALFASRHSSYFGASKTTVYKVTNLNASGPGSLREALDAAGPRTIVFEVSGNIDFTPYTAVSITSPYVTVAGQTAPSPGITLKGCELIINTHDVLVQHIRVRTGDLADPSRPIKYKKSGWTQFTERDCMKVSGHHIIIDHCSFSWSTDENVQSNASNVTFRHNIISEGLNSPKHHKGGHSKGLLLRGVSNDRSQNVAIIGNLLAHNHGRNPRVAGAARAAVINNLTYNAWIGNEVGIHAYAKDQDKNPLHISTWIGNVVIEGEYGRTFIPNYRGDKKVVVRRRIPSDPTIIAFWLLDLGSAVGPPRRSKCPPGRVFIGDMRVGYRGKNGAYIEEVLADPLKSRFVHANKIWMGGKWTLHPERSIVKKPSVVVPGLKIRPSADVQKWVLANAGARPADRDPVDARVVKSVREHTGTIPKSQEDVGGWPELEKNRRELTVPENPSGDDDGDGYTNLEEWLHAFAAEVEGKKQ